MTRIVRYLHYLCVLLCGLWFWGCDAPRDNPLDPGAGNFINPNYQVGSIAGQVTDLKFENISDVLVLTLPYYRGAVTDENGHYHIDDIPIGDCQIYAEHDDFVSETLAVSVTFQQTTNADFNLDALPQIFDFQVTSHYSYDEGASTPEYNEVRVTALLRDPDGFNDIDSVLLVTAEHPTWQPLMTYSPDSSQGDDSLFYYLVLPEGSLPGESIDSVKWDHFQCRVVDKSGHFSLSDVKTIMRVFEDCINQVDPINGISVDPTNLVLSWNPFYGQFNYTHSVFIYLDPSDIAVWDTTGISTTITSVKVGTVLSSGAYYWRIAVIDEWGDSSLSGKAKFTVPS